MNLVNGIFNLTDQQYRGIPAMNKSSLDDINQSPAHYQYHKANPEPANMAMLLGSAVHAAVLEPDKFNDLYFFRPEGLDGRTKAGKEELEKIGRENAGKTMLKFEEWTQVKAMSDAVKNHYEASRLLADGLMEHSIIAKDKARGLWKKGKIDCITPSNILIDLKTTSYVDERPFRSSILNYRYHVQAAYYLDLMNEAIADDNTRAPYEQFVFIVIEKDAPYGIKIYSLDAASIESGRAEYQRNLDTYADCLERNFWPSYSGMVQPISIFN